MGKKLFFIDAETDGLYGAFISAAVVVTTEEGKEVERFYYGIRKEKLNVHEAWVVENVLPVMGAYTPCEDEEELVERVWKAWEKYKDDSYAIGDVIYPVEARLFLECVKHDESRRTFQAPYPLLDLSALLYAKGIDPLEEREKLLGDIARKVGRHNALGDVLISIEIYKKIFEKGKR